MENNIIPTNCPSCESPLMWTETGVDLICNNKSCPAQNVRSILHFFRILDNLDGFGPKVVENLIYCGFDTVAKIYNMKYNDFLHCGYKSKTIINLGSELEESKKRPIENYTLLAALGIEGLGIGNSKKYCETYVYDSILKILPDKMIELEGFGEKTSDSIYNEVQNRTDEIQDIFDIGFTIVVQSAHGNIDSPISGKAICFTGKSIVPRKQMQKQAEELGAKPVGGVNSKTDILVCGGKVGANKTNAAKKFETKVLTEEEYFELIKDFT